MSIVLIGSTSGSITLQEPAVAGSTVIDLPATSGTMVVTGGSQTIEFADGSAATPSITNSGDTNTGIFFPVADTIAASTAGSERMRIDSNGYTMIGVTSALNDSRLSVSQGSASNAMFIATAGAGNRAIGFINSSTFVGDIVTSVSSVAYNTSSDYRLKENVAPMTGALAKVALLKPCTYTWKIDGSEGQGFIAHELQSVVPDAVSGEKDAVETYTDEDGNEQTRIKPQGVDTSFLVATLTSAIQELKAELDATKAEVQALKGVA